VEIKERLRTLNKMLDSLEGEWILVEGKRDRAALASFGLDRCLTISGNLRASCGLLAGKKAEKAYVLTDLDRRGDELAKSARDELESLSIRADTEMRLKLAHMLRIRYFEDAARAFERLKQEYAEKEGEIYG